MCILCLMRLHIATGWRQRIFWVVIFFVSEVVVTCFSLPVNRSKFSFGLFRSIFQWVSCPSAETHGTTDQWTAKTMDMFIYPQYPMIPLGFNKTPQKMTSNKKPYYIYILGVASACLFDVSVRIPERFLKSPELFLKT